MKAVWKGKVLAESDETIIVEGNHYFPDHAIHKEFFKESDTKTYCGWKGTASYYTVSIAGKENPDSAWYYPEPKQAAHEIKGYISFWRGIDIVK